MGKIPERELNVVYRKYKKLFTQLDVEYDRKYDRIDSQRGIAFEKLLKKYRGKK